MKQVFIMMNGFSLSGKTYLARKIEKRFAKAFVIVDTRTIHDFLNEKFPLFKDGNTIEEEAYELRQKATTAVREAFIKAIIEEGYSVILDSCNLTREKRQKLLKSMRELAPKAKRVIIHVDISEEKLLKRLKSLDKRNIKSGEKPAWEDLYTKVQKKHFEKPTKDETDVLINYKAGNEKKVLDKLAKILE